MITRFKAKSVRADMEFGAFEILDLLERRKVRVDLVPFEVKDYTRLATVNRFCAPCATTGWRDPAGDIDHDHEKPDHYYPHKCTADVTCEENVGDEREAREAP